MQLLLEELKETHATSAGLKAFCTWNTLNIIDQSRQACGGHGYSSYNGLPGLYNDFAVHCSWEGDNTILTLQLGRYLIQQGLAKEKGKVMPKGVTYLNELPSILSKKHKGALTLQSISEAWHMVSAHAVNKAVQLYKSKLKDNVELAFEDTSFERFHAAKIHSTGYLYQRFYDAVQVIHGNDTVKTLMGKYCLLYGAYSIIQVGSEFLSANYYTASDLQELTGLVTDLCAELRREVIKTTDAFGYTVL